MEPRPEMDSGFPPGMEAAFPPGMSYSDFMNLPREQQMELRELFASLASSSTTPTPTAAAEKAIDAAFGKPPGISNCGVA